MSRGNVGKKKPSFRGGKNKKKSWKKCDITEVEEYLEDKRLEERIGDVSRKANEELFCLESTGEKSSDVKNKIKTLKCHSNIGAFTKVPPPIVIDKEPFSKKIQNAQFRADERRRKSSRLRSSQVKKENENRISNDLYTADLKDLWCEEEKIDPEIKDFVIYHKEITCEKTPKVPLHRFQKPSLLPAVEVPHAGASYNPTFEDHQKLLSDALEIEEAKNQEELHLKRVLTDMFPTKENAPTPESILKEMSQGLFDEEGMEEQDEAEEPMSRFQIPPVTTENRIPKSRKRRKKEQKEQERLKKLEQLHKMQLNQVYRLRSIKGEIKQEEEISEKRQEKKLQRKIDKMYKPLTLSKHKYEAPDIEIHLSDELCDSLRTLKAEGNLLEDRYKSLQRRNLIEPRVVVKRKRKYKLKVQVKRSHRNFQ